MMTEARQFPDGCRCRWVAGDPQTKNWCCCGEPAIEGSAYCEFHHRLTHIPHGSEDEKRERARMYLLANNKRAGRESAHVRLVA